MTNYKKKLVIGTRSSPLAMAQTKLFVDKILLSYPDMDHSAIQICPIKTSGDQNQSVRLDQMGGKGLFAKEIENEIRKGQIDLGIHSMKDMPANESEDLLIGCWMERDDYREALLTALPIDSISKLSKSAIVGTSSIRRRSQIMNLRSDLGIRSLRGNIDTRIQKLKENKYDAIVLSKAGLERLSLGHLISYTFTDKELLPAACQGAIGIQMLSSNKELKNFLSPINHSMTQDLCNIERDVLKTIKANCNSPIGLLAKKVNDNIILQCEIFDHGGNRIYTNLLKEDFSQKNLIGKKIGNDILLKLGQTLIDNLDILKDDFDYTP